MILDGRVAVVTGGGQGIGEAVARALARQGATVVLAGRRPEPLEAVARAIRDAGGNAWVRSCDVTDPEEVDALAREVHERDGGAAILVNNAGVSAADPVHRTSLDTWNRLLAVNATGSFLCIRAFLPGMLDAGWGRIVNVASVAGLQGAPYIAAYAASKHAQVGLTRAVAAEVGGRGVTVNAVCPGYVDTPMTEASVTRIVEKTGRDPAEVRDLLGAQNAHGRLVQPHEVADAVLAFCAPDAQEVNGVCRVLDGSETPEPAAS